MLPQLIAIALLAGSSSSSAGAAAPRPHIILALIDDWGHSDVGFTNRLVDGKLRTPRLDELSSAAGGVVLRNYYVQHICTPTRSVLLSGRYQIHTGLQHATIHPAQPSSLPVDIPLISDELQRLNCESQCDDLQPSTRKFHLTQSGITCLYRRNAKRPLEWAVPHAPPGRGGVGYVGVASADRARGRDAGLLLLGPF